MFNINFENFSKLRGNWSKKRGAGNSQTIVEIAIQLQNSLKVDFSVFHGSALVQLALDVKVYLQEIQLHHIKSKMMNTEKTHKKHIKSKLSWFTLSAAIAQHIHSHITNSQTIFSLFRYAFFSLFCSSSSIVIVDFVLRDSGDTVLFSHCWQETNYL